MSRGPGRFRLALHVAVQLGLYHHPLGVSGVQSLAGQRSPEGSRDFRRDCLRVGEFPRYSRMRTTRLPAWGTHEVSNPVRSPGFRASASDGVQHAAFATGVPSDIYAFHRSTGSSACPYPPRGIQYQGHFPGWAGGFHP